jgi:integrase
VEVIHGGKKHRVRTYLPELLEIAAGTGRRISAICRLRYSDLRLDQGPHGSIRWPADTDKMRKEWITPISPQVRQAINRVLAERPGIGDAYLFPSPKVPGAPLRYELASSWLLKAEKLAGVPKQDGTLWHAYRPKWATERKHLPDVDVAAAGGWKSPQTLRMIYQQPA